MANLALALDEIIQQDNKKSIGSRGGGIRQPRAEGLVAGVKTSARTRFPQRGFVSGEVPAGRWKHDKFFETYGGAKKGGIAPKKQLGLIGRRSSRTILGGKSSGGIAARLARKAIGAGQSGLVKLQISNLPDTVVTSDLEELFQEYNCYGVTVHYDEGGAHLGTGDLFTDQQSANQILREFKDIAIDGQEICFCIVSESGTTAAAGIIDGRRAKPTIRDRLRRIGSGSNPIGKKRTLVKKRLSGGGGGGRVGAARAGAAGRKARMNAASGRGGTASTGKAKTAEELDMELDAYMQKK